MEDKYLEKAKVLSKYFSMYGLGNFDLSLEEIARILQLICEKKNNQYLDVNLQEIYERLYKSRMG